MFLSMLTIEQATYRTIVGVPSSALISHSEPNHPLV
jgi:hypothetical protein